MDKNTVCVRGVAWAAADPLKNVLKTYQISRRTDWDSKVTLAGEKPFGASSLREQSAKFQCWTTGGKNANEKEQTKLGWCESFLILVLFFFFFPSSFQLFCCRWKLLQRKQERSSMTWCCQAAVPFMVIPGSVTVPSPWDFLSCKLI